MRKLVLFIAILLLSALPGRTESGEWNQLFNRKDMTGWEHVGPGRFVIEEGILRSDGGMGLLWYTPEKIGNAVIRVVYRLSNENTNSGVFIRIPEKPTEEWMPVHRGYEVQILNTGDDYHCTGVLYSLTKALARPYKPVDQWNTLEITLDGPHTVVVLNGVKVTDYTEGQPVPDKKDEWEPDHGPRPKEGYFGLQNHSDKDIVFFKEVAMKPLR